MEINIICPECSTITKYQVNCENCGYHLGNDELLIFHVLVNYNKALNLIRDNRLVDAWRILKPAIHMYPYEVTSLFFSFKLAQQCGEFEFAHHILGVLCRVISDDYRNKFTAELNENIATYNNILTDKAYSPSDHDNLLLIHYYLLYLKSGHDNLYISKMQLFDTTIQDGPTTPSLTLVNKKSIAALCLALVLVITVSIYQFYQNERLETLYANLTNREKSARDDLDSTQRQLALQNDKTAKLPKRDIEEERVLDINRNKILNLEKLGIEDQEYAAIINELCAGLYRQGDYSSILKIAKETKIDVQILPHADYRLARKTLNNDIESGIKATEAWVSKFPDYPAYTAEALYTLVKYYSTRNMVAARKYASQLKKYVMNYETGEYRQYYNSAVKRILRNDDSN